MFRDYNRALVLEHPRISQKAREAHAEMLSLSFVVGMIWSISSKP